MTQNDMILEHLKRGDSITQMEATTLYGCTRLSGRIYDLRHMGHKIKKTMESAVNRYGVTVSYARYMLDI